MEEINTINNNNSNTMTRISTTIMTRISSSIMIKITFKTKDIMITMEIISWTKITNTINSNSITMITTNKIISIKIIRPRVELLQMLIKCKHVNLRLQILNQEPIVMPFKCRGSDLPKALNLELQVMPISSREINLEQLAMHIKCNNNSNRNNRKNQDF